MFAASQPRTPRGGYNSGRRTPNKERPSGNGQTPQRSRPGQTPQRERPGNLPTETPVFDAEDFPELPKELTVLPRGRKDRRSAWEWEEVGEDGAGARTRSLSRGQTPQSSRGRRERSYSESDAVTEEEPKAPTDTPTEAPKDAAPTYAPTDAPTKAPAICEKAEKGLQRAEAMERARAKMLAGAAELAALELEAQGNPPNGDAASMAEQQVSQLQSEEAATRPRRRSGAKPTLDDNCVMFKPPGSESWDFPMSRDEKKARVVMLDHQVVTFEIDQLEQEVSALNQKLASREE